MLLQEFDAVDALSDFLRAIVGAVVDDDDLVAGTVKRLLGETFEQVRQGPSRVVAGDDDGEVHVSFPIN
jgi:dsRNA-specific ribonuclease